MENKNNEELSFENAMVRLEEIVRQLERGSVPLEESLRIFEEGVSLVKLCTGKLDKCEQKISMLVKKADDTYDEQDFTKAE